MKKYVIIGLIGVLSGLVFLGILVFNHSAYPEKAVLGEWKEVSWVYQLGENTSKNITAQEREAVANHLVVHEFENWTFTKDYRIKLHERTGKEHFANWRLKGRGHVLNLLNPDGTIETYSIEELNKNTLELHFQTDLQARGIIKITLQKIK